jgi:hypothetical protein
LSAQPETAKTPSNAQADHCHELNLFIINNALHK